MSKFDGLSVTSTGGLTAPTLKYATSPVPSAESYPAVALSSTERAASGLSQAGSTEDAHLGTGNGSHQSGCRRTSGGRFVVTGHPIPCIEYLVHLSAQSHPSLYPLASTMPHAPAGPRLHSAVREGQELHRSSHHFSDLSSPPPLAFQELSVSCQSRDEARGLSCAACRSRFMT